MSVANLTRYGFVFKKNLENAIFDVENDGPYVKFEEAVAASSNSLQQLKAEIASRLRDYDEYEANGQRVMARLSLNAIRQLSAV